MKFASFMGEVRKNAVLKRDEALYLFVNKNKIPPMGTFFMLVFLWFIDKTIGEIHL